MARNLGLPVALLLAGAVLGSQPELAFWKPIETTVTNAPTGDAVAADLNGDSLPDLIVSTPGAGAILVAIARGDGSFEDPASYAVSAGVGDLAVADFNNDGALDVVVAAAGITVLLGNGDGTLQSPIVSGGSGRDVVAADFDRDGFTDVASVGNNFTSAVPETVDIYAGLGDGTFGPPHTIHVTDNFQRELAVGDFNGDGWPDLTFGVSYNRGQYVMLNGGNFVFTLASLTFTEVGPLRTVTGDLDDDGSVDVVVVNAIGTISVLFGNGDGTLQDPVTLGVGRPHCPDKSCPEAVWVELADMNEDGILDIVTANTTPGGASILLNNGDGTFDSPVQIKALTYGVAALPGDFNGDGEMDLAVLSSDAGQFDDGPRIGSIFLNKLRSR